MNSLTATPGARSVPVSDRCDRDALLQASRRVDWRFLLPDPNLGETACIGRVEADLIGSLRQFSDSVTIVDPGQSMPVNPAQYALVIARNASRSELRRAAELTRRGGFLYVELDKRTPLPRQLDRLRDERSSRDVRAQTSLLEQLGLADPQIHWHWPDFESCNEIIPLGDRVAGICSLRRRGGDARARWKRRIARLLLETRLLERFVPCISILARRPS